MTTSMDVCNAIAEVVAGVWPERMIYRDFCPVDHQRPSSYLYVTESGFEPVNPFLMQWSMEAVLELYCSTDQYDISSTEELRQDQEQVLLAFGTPVLKIGDRHITLSVKGGAWRWAPPLCGFLPPGLTPGRRTRTPTPRAAVFPRWSILQ